MDKFVKTQRVDEAARPAADRAASDLTRKPARILVVEDQEDVRRMLVTALEIEGYAVDDAASAAAGLARLAASRYDLVISDYAMPGGTGTAMLHEANKRGLMGSTLALIVTAHPEVHELADVEVIQKPLDLDFFLLQIRRILASGHNGEPGHEVESAKKVGSMEKAGYRVELVLYISTASRASIQARRNLEQLLARFEASQVKLTVWDLIRNPQAGEADRIAFTPTLVKRFPEPRLWMLGNLREADLLADLLRVCGVDEKA